jgi:4-aminobutyrate aminotransferase
LNLPPNTPVSELTEQCLYQLDLLLAQQTNPKDTAAIIVEPVLGEGGYVAAPKEFLEGLREVCDRHGMLLIVDEVQSGYGRTGPMFAIEESGVRPDIMVIAKGLGNGFPISGVISRKELTDKLAPGTMVRASKRKFHVKANPRVSTVGRNVCWECRLLCCRR